MARHQPASAKPFAASWQPCQLVVQRSAPSLRHRLRRHLPSRRRLQRQRSRQPTSPLSRLALPQLASPRSAPLPLPLRAQSRPLSKLPTSKPSSKLLRSVQLQSSAQSRLRDPFPIRSQWRRTCSSRRRWRKQRCPRQASKRPCSLPCSARSVPSMAEPLQRSSASSTSDCKQLPHSCCRSSMPRRLLL